MAEGARLESVYTGNRIVGSNPTPSASMRYLGYLIAWFRSFEWPGFNVQVLGNSAAVRS